MILVYGGFVFVEVSVGVVCRFIDIGIDIAIDILFDFPVFVLWCGLLLGDWLCQRFRHVGMHCEFVIHLPGHG